jgi:hypothetical protein
MMVRWLLLTGQYQFTSNIGTLFTTMAGSASNLKKKKKGYIEQTTCHASTGWFYDKCQSSTNISQIWNESLLFKLILFQLLVFTFSKKHGVCMK